MSATNGPPAPKPACGASTVIARWARKPSIWPVRLCVTVTRTSPVDGLETLSVNAPMPPLAGLMRRTSVLIRVRPR